MRTLKNVTLCRRYAGFVLVLDTLTQAGKLSTHTCGLSRAYGHYTGEFQTDGQSNLTFASQFAVGPPQLARKQTNDLLGGADRLEPVCGAADGAGAVTLCLSAIVSRSNFHGGRVSAPISLGGAPEIIVGFPIQNASIPQKSNRKQPVDFHQRLAHLKSIP